MLAENITHLCIFYLLHMDRNVHVQFCKTENYLCMQQPERAKCSLLIYYPLKAKHQANLYLQANY